MSMESARNILYNWGPTFDDKVAATGKFLFSAGFTLGFAYLSSWRLTAMGVSTVAGSLATAHFLIYSTRTARSAEDKEITYDNAWRLKGKISLLSIFMGQAVANLAIAGLVWRANQLAGGLFKGFSRGQCTLIAAQLACINGLFLGGVVYLSSRERFQPRLAPPRSD